MKPSHESRWRAYTTAELVVLARQHQDLASERLRAAAHDQRAADSIRKEIRRRKKAKDTQRT